MRTTSEFIDCVNGKGANREYKWKIENKNGRVFKTRRGDSSSFMEDSFMEEVIKLLLPLFLEALLPLLLK